MENIKDRVVIAKFMDMCQRPDEEDTWWINTGVSWVVGADDTKALKYHSSWDWLMPVVKKINTIAHEQELYDVAEYEQLADYLIGADIDNTFRHVIEFIEWYNLQGSN